jgi:GDP-4-dehydro-6-deoxy-D-mannose reductase
MRALITGGYGFVGRHLSQHLVKCGDDVAMTYMRGRDENPEDINPNDVQVPKVVQSLALDVTDRNAVNEVISLLKPDAVYHLAALTFIPECENEQEGLFQVNTQGTINLLEAIHEYSAETRFLLASSAEVYGEPIPGSLPLTEASVMRPVSSYGVTKAAADCAAFKFSFRERVHTIRVRAFPHIGPGQNARFSISGFAKQLAEIKLGQREPKVYVGNLEAKRDFCDVSDVVRGYREALLNGKRGEAYNLCSGKSVEIGEVLNMLIKITGVDVEVVVDPERVRPVDIADAFGSYEKAQRDFGWKPRIGLEATLHSLFAYWVEFLS